MVEQTTINCSKDDFPTSPAQQQDRDWIDFAAGAGAAFINIGTTYPVYKLILRQMVDGLTTREAFLQLKHEGMYYLYRGLLPPLLQKGASVSIMFGVYQKFHKLISRTVPGLPKEASSGFAGILAGTAEAVLTPFERVQTLLSHHKHNHRFNNTLHAFRDIRLNCGYREFYRGLTPVLMRNGPSNALFFSLRGKIKKALPDTQTNVMNTINDFVSGAVLGGFLSTCFYPVNVVKTKMQTQLGGAFLSFIATFRTVFNERNRSIRQLYYGVSLNFTRAIVSWGIINASFEIVKKILIN